MGTHFAKSKTVHSFNELSQDGAHALIDDIIAVYHYYCIGRIGLKSDGIYKLETTENEKRDMPSFVLEYIGYIKQNNERQGKNGVYFGHGRRETAIVRAILLRNEMAYDAETIDMLISAVADTLLISQEDISTKLDAIALWMS